MSVHRMQAVVDRLFTDRDFQARFRRDPEVAVRAYGLTEDETRAVKRGNAAELAGWGIDVRRYEQVPAPRSGLSALLLRVAPIPLALMLAAAAVAGTSGQARASARLGRWSGRAIRALGRHWDTGLGRRALVRHRALSKSGKVGFRLPIDLMQEQMADDGGTNDSGGSVTHQP